MKNDTNIIKETKSYKLIHDHETMRGHNMNFPIIPKGTTCLKMATVLGFIPWITKIIFATINIVETRTSLFYTPPTSLWAMIIISIVDVNIKIV